MSVTTTEQPNSSLINFIERASRDPEFDVAKFGELLRLQRDVEHDRARREFNQAMAAAQAEMQPVVRDAKNSHLGNRYAKLETIDAAMRPIYTRHGFSVRYGSAPAPAEGHIRITCTVAHAAGYFEESYLDSPLGNPGSQGGRTQTTPVQAVGSAITYLRRYLLCMVYNVVLADDDDDGEAQRKPAGSRPTTAYTPGSVATASLPAGKTDEQWRRWLDKLYLAARKCTTRGEVAELGGGAEIADALRTGPPFVKEAINSILAEAFAAMPEDGGPAIPGEEKMDA